MGRPSTYTAEIAAAIVERLSAGETLRAICRDEHMPPAPTVRLWVIDDREGFAAQYARARDLGLDAMAEELLDIADDSSGDEDVTDGGTRKLNNEFAQRSKLRVDTRKFYLSKIAPHRYGEHLRIESDAIASLAAGLADARKRSGD